MACYCVDCRCLSHCLCLCLIASLNLHLHLKRGMSIHEHIIESVSDLDVYVGSNLVDMHAKCGTFKMLETTQQDAHA